MDCNANTNGGVHVVSTDSPELHSGNNNLADAQPDSTVQDETDSKTTVDHSAENAFQSANVKEEPNDSDATEDVVQGGHPKIASDTISEPIVIKTGVNSQPVVVSKSGGNRARKSICNSPNNNDNNNKTKPAAKKQATAGKPKPRPPAPIATLIHELTHPDTGQFPGGVSPKQLLEYLSSGKNESPLACSGKNQLQVQLCRHANRGNLVRMQTGYYTTPDLVDEIVSRGIMKRHSPVSHSARDHHREANDRGAVDAMEASNDVSTKKTSPETGGGRNRRSASIEGGEDRPPKRKRTKKEIGADFVTYNPDAQKQKSAVCDFCLFSAQKNMSGKHEAMLFCKDCPAKAHPRCMGYTEELASRCRRSPWQCIDCKTCIICSNSNNADTLLFCDSCDKGYHMACHSPVIDEKPPGKWICNTCTLDNPPSPTASPVSEEFKKMIHARPMKQKLKRPANSWLRIQPGGIVPHCNCDANPVLPDLSCGEAYRKAALFARTWTSLDVSEFIKELGFDNEAKTFADQEIDGQALLLLKRSDVLSRLSLKLGPALKLYRRILAVQNAFEKMNSGCQD